MALHKIRRGLDLPISGAPDGPLGEAPQVSRVAVVAADYIGMKPTMHVKVGDSVQRGQLLFEDKKTPGVRYTAIGDGKVAAIHRGERRALQSVVLELTAAERAGRSSDSRFKSFTGQHPSSMTAEQIRDLLLESGQWVALRQRPFSRVPAPQSTADAIFVTVADSNPLAPSPAEALEGRRGDLERGLTALGKLTEGPVFVCTPPGLEIDLPSQGEYRREEFAGPHPAGTAGLHMHLLAPASRQRTIWWIGYQDTLAIGRLFDSGNLDVSRVVSLAGPSVTRPRVVRTRVGAFLDELVAGELSEGENRVISGSAIYGRSAMGEVHGYLGRHHNQVTALPEGREREFFGWLAPGLDKHSVTSVFLSKLVPGKLFESTTAKNGSDRAIVPIGVYEKVFPFDLPPSYLLRALSAGDLEYGEELGVLELDEEDLALCSYVCPGKQDYGTLLRDMLTTIEKEG
jgi:Na+-transporting NADH:ubiquinone oxidoreductase subunit A